LAVCRVALTAFRSYRDARFSFDTSPVILTGQNGCGKTNFLEALSLLVPGRGLRRASLADLQNTAFPTAPWAVAVDMVAPHGPLLIGTGGLTAETFGALGETSERRQIHIDGKPARNQQQLGEHVTMAWITPDMDRIFADGPSARRKLLDRLVFGYDSTHSARVNRYEKALRERARLLREEGGRADPRWLDALENDMAQSSVAIAAARRDTLRQLALAMEETVSAFPCADFVLTGVAEQGLQESPAILVEDRLRDLLAQSRTDDARAGSCAFGAHRADMMVTHRAKQCPADLCSTGEQKALLIAMILAHMRGLTRHRGAAPLLLLDDIAAHLDEARRAALFEEIRALNTQAWLTGTDRGFFEALLPYAQHFPVKEAG